MPLPYFFIPQIANTNENLVLDEDQSKHIIQVLRMQNGEELLLSDGKGTKAHVEIIDDHRKHCTVKNFIYHKRRRKKVKNFHCYFAHKKHVPF